MERGQKTDIYSRPVVFAVVAAAVVLAGTLVTTFIPLFMPGTQPVSSYIKPYSPVEVEGRDIYIREGCNNCHTQTVRPLRTEVVRYGEYSKPEEFAYDRPFLWGSRRTGPDLARIGGKYPDSWHYQHTVDPQSMFPKSNMPPYRWLAERKLNTNWTYRKVSVLGYGLDPDEVRKQLDRFREKVSSPSYQPVELRDRVVPHRLQGEITELDALVAYLQKVGRDLKELKKGEAEEVSPPHMGMERNPYEGSAPAAEEGMKLYDEKCSSCHGEEGRGGIGPNLTDREWKYGSGDGDLFRSIWGGRPGGMPPFKGILSEDAVWKVVTFLRNAGEE